MNTPPPSERGTVRRLPQRASYEEAVIHSILDEGPVAHVGVAVEGQPYVIPMVYGRGGRHLYLHGASVSRLARQLAQGVPVCVTVTLLDGLVLARSAFHHSANYRSVVVLGTAALVTDDEEKTRALETITDHALRGRWAEVRPPNAQELKATSVLRLPLDEPRRRSALDRLATMTRICRWSVGRGAPAAPAGPSTRARSGSPRGYPASHVPVRVPRPAGVFVNPG
ncbi:pyridoxamine 5'-phosphate oxidase family protein [Cystobacter fuscus]